MYWKTSAPTECVRRHNRTLLFQRNASVWWSSSKMSHTGYHFLNFSVFFLKMLCKRRYWWWLMFLFLESLLVFPDLSFPLEYWICNYKKYMECRLYVQDRTQSNPDTRQTAVLCLRDGDLPCIENKNKRSQRKACLPLERQPIDGL